MSAPEDSLGDYKLIARLAAGGMGTVHLARTRGRLGFSRPVAVKTLHPHLLHDPRLVLRFLDEARLAAKIQHPNVIPVVDVGHEGDRVFLVMDYVHGASLSSLLGQPIRVDIVLAIGRDVLQGLAAAHETTDDTGRNLAIVHRDVSPQNILVSVRGVAYVTDFGIAKALGSLGQTESNEVLGKVAYMPPEQIGGGAVTARSDLFSFGVVVWEMLTAEKLVASFGAQTLPSFTERVKQLAQLAPETPPALVDFVERLLSVSPDRRPQTAKAALRELLAIGSPASSDDVSDWVRDRAARRLDQLDVLLRESSTADSGREEALRFASAVSSRPQLPSAEASSPSFDGTIQLPTRALPRERGPRLLTRILVVAVTAAVVVAAGAVVLAVRSRPRTAHAETAVASLLPSPPPPSSSEPEASAAPLSAPPPAASTAPTASTKPVRTSPVRAVAPVPKPASSKPAAHCNPPFVYDEHGLKRYIPGCFHEEAP